MDVMHADGPWNIVPYGDGDSLVIHVGHTQNRVCFMATPSNVTDDLPRIKANARLIAAAPDMLTALKRVYYEWDGEPEDMIHVQAAIAKATHS